MKNRFIRPPNESLFVSNHFHFFRQAKYFILNLRRSNQVSCTLLFKEPDYEKTIVSYRLLFLYDLPRFCTSTRPGTR